MLLDNTVLVLVSLASLCSSSLIKIQLDVENLFRALLQFPSVSKARLLSSFASFLFLFASLAVKMILCTVDEIHTCIEVCASVLYGNWLRCVSKSGLTIALSSNNVKTGGKLAQLLFRNGVLILQDLSTWLTASFILV